MVSDGEFVAGFAKHEAALRAYVKGLIPHSTRSLLDQDDILQETYTSAWLHATDFRGGSMLAWLKTLAKRTVIDRVRAFRAQKRGGNRKAFRVGAGVRGSSSGIAVQGQNRSPSSEAAHREVRIFVTMCLEQLSPQHQEVLKLRYMEHHRVADVAGKLGISTPAAQMRLKRAHEQLYTQMRRHELPFSDPGSRVHG